MKNRIVLMWGITGICLILTVVFWFLMNKTEVKYELHNVHGLAGYYKGKSVKAFLSNNKLYANVEGIKSTSPIAIVYFIFLFGTFAMVMASATYMSKIKEKKLKNQ